MKDIQVQLDKIKKKVVVVVFPHPDDESVMAGGLIQRALMSEFRVVVVCLTKGGRGKVHINGGGRSLEEIRADEFKKAMQILGVSESYLWSFLDGNLAGTKDWHKKLLDFLIKAKPGLVVSYDHSGISGHPDHVIVARAVFAWAKGEGVDLWWPSFEGKMGEMMVDRRVSNLLPHPDLRLDLSRKEVFTKWRAIGAHASQGWSSLSIWPSCVGFLLKHPYEKYAKANFQRKYGVRYIRFAF